VVSGLRGRRDSAARAAVQQRVFVDRKLTKETDVVFNAGTHTNAIRLPYAAFATIAQPVVGDYGELPPAGKRSAAHDGRGLWT
jgi:hypothetical protein